jgi:hypothetical protein
MVVAETRGLEPMALEKKVPFAISQHITEEWSHQIPGLKMQIVS